MIKKFAGPALLGIGMLATAGSAMALDLRFTPRAGLGIQKYSLNYVSYGALTPGDNKDPGHYFKIDEYMPALTIGGTVSMDRLYLDAYWQQTDTSGETYSIWGPDADTGVNNLYKANRKDFSLSIGYAFETGLTVFGGYKHGKTDINGHWWTATSLAISHSTTAENASFEEQGPFLGLGYGLHLGSGILSLTGAWAWLDGEIKDVYQDTHLHTDASKPSATGMALSLAWKAPITDKLSYSLSLDAYQYDYEKKLLVDTTGGNPSFNLKAKEESVGVRASLAYSF